MLFDQMKTIKDKVKFLLESFPHLRDDDFKLIATFYKFTVSKDRLESMTALEFLQMFASGQLPHSESIRRDRQKLQEKNEHLQGERYKQRQEDGRKTKEKIGNL